MKKEGLRKRGGGGVKIHPFHLPWIRVCDLYDSWSLYVVDLCLQANYSLTFQKLLHRENLVRTAAFVL